MLRPEPGQVDGLRVSKLTSTAAQVMWSKLACREHNGVAVGYMYELRRVLQHGQPALNVMFGIVNDTALDLKDLVPFTNYNISIRFANHAHRGPRASLDFVTFEDGESFMLTVAFFKMSKNFQNFCMFLPTGMVALKLLIR